MVNNKLEFTGSEFFDVLREFQDRVKEGAFKKTVPYDIWRKLKLTQKPVSFDFIEDYQLGEVLFDEGHSYSEYFYEKGLIAFLYDKWVAINNDWLPGVKEEDDMTTRDALKVALIDSKVALIDSTNDDLLAAKIEPEINGSVMISPEINGSVMISNDDWLEELGEKKTQKLEDLIDNLNTRIDEIIEKMADKADMDITTKLYNYTVQDRADITKLENKAFQNCAKIDYVSNRIDELNGSLSAANDIIFDLKEEFINLAKRLEEKEDKIKCEIEVNESKENKRMKNFNFDFGPCTNDNVRMSMYGMAVKNAAGTYVSFNPATREIVDVDIFNFDGSKYMYKMPVATKDVAVGDVIIHQRKPMFVEGFTELGGVMAVDPVAGERKEIMLTKSPFGFNFVTKVVSLFNMYGTATPTTEQPFGNMLPFMLMNEEGGDIDPMMLMFMMGQSGGANTSAFGNPMMMYFLMKDKGEIDPMMMFMMMNQQQPHTCQCGCAENKA